MYSSSSVSQRTAPTPRTGLRSLEDLVNVLIRKYEQQNELEARRQQRRSQPSRSARRRQTVQPVMVAANTSESVGYSLSPQRQATFAFYEQPVS